MRTEAARARLTYSIADLHGRLDLLEKSLSAIAAHAVAHAGSAPQRVVFLGDYVDRGPQSADVLARLAGGPSCGWRWICLKGNHEAMMSTALREPDRLDWWLDNGGDATIASYRGRRGLIAAHLSWTERLPSIYTDEARIFVHAGVDPDLPLESQSERNLVWKRYVDGDERGHGTRHVVHGHTPDIAGPHVLAGRTALDTLAWYTGRLVVAVFDDAKSGAPIDMIEVRAQHG